jgi:pimeloyl-ACP methyl ester carboxylesterase
MVYRPTPTQTGDLHFTKDDVSIHWDYFGQGEREVCVFMNGLGMLTESWYTSVPQVHPEFDVLLFDYLGQGRSSRRTDIPYLIPKFCEYLVRIMDHLGIEKVHTQGVSYGGFIAADFGRLYQDRLHTQTISGILLTRELSFQMYQDLSLKFYESEDPAIFDIYTRYLYEKIFSEKFLNVIWDKLEKMRTKFFENYKKDISCLARLTQAQDPFFENIEENLAGYQAVETPTLVLAGEYDRAIPLWMQRKLVDIFPNSKLIVFPACGHLTYFEEPQLFWSNLKALARVKSVDYEMPIDAPQLQIIPSPGDSSLSASPPVIN